MSDPVMNLPYMLQLIFFTGLTAWVIVAFCAIVGAVHQILKGWCDFMIWLKRKYRQHKGYIE